MQTIDNGGGTYTHTITPDDISAADMARMTLMYGTYAPVRPVARRPQLIRQWETRANDGPVIRRRRVIAGRRVA